MVRSPLVRRRRAVGAVVAIYEKISGSADLIYSKISQVSGIFGNNQFLIQRFLLGLVRDYVRQREIKFPVRVTPEAIQRRRSINAGTRPWKFTAMAARSGAAMRAAPARR
jgi:hypothetical protein